jgi:hypothetical protein
MKTYLSKSDFKLAQECPSKLFLKKKKYTSTKNNDPYLQLLAEGGYVVEEIAHLRYPNGVMVSHSANTDADVERTKRILSAYSESDITLFEPTFEWQGRLVRVDIFNKMGDSIELIEVKAKSWNSSEPGNEKGSYLTKNGGIRAPWRPYLEDVTYQSIVIEKLFPEYRVVPYLMMPDQAKQAASTIKFDQFRVHKTNDPDSGRTNYSVDYLGDEPPYVGEDFLIKLNVSDAVDLLRLEVDSQAEVYLDSVSPLRRIDVPIGSQCFKCEYRTGDLDDGFSLCWGNRANAAPHIMDLYQGGRLPGIGALIGGGVSRITEVDDAFLWKKDGTRGSLNTRRVTQIEHTKSQSEWIGASLSEDMAGHEYPYHFIDFEAARMAVPYHEGLHPYQQVAFQWSCHTMTGPDEPLVHSEWINTTDRYPNFAFARSLFEQLGDNGSIFIWSPFENTALREIYDEMIRVGHDDSELINWLKTVVRFTKGGPTRLIDMHRMCVDGYLHPRMKGRTGIKYTLDAVWQEEDWIRREWEEYLVVEGDRILSPYAGLPVIRVGETEVAVAEGTGAIRAYEAMMYGLERDDPNIKQEWKEALLRYCKLDTAAMVMIWKYWARRTE